MKVIGISGHKQSGKDTAANILCTMCEELHLKYSFGSHVKKEVAMACNCSVEYIEQHKDVFRTMLQWWGTEYRRHFFGQDYWIKKMRDAIRHLDENGFKMIVIPDVRFINEYEFLRSEYDAPIYRVERVNGAVVDLHRSETELDNAEFDLVLHNNGTVHELVNEIKRQIVI